MRITIPDDLAQVYQTLAAEIGKPIDAVIAFTLTRFSTVNPMERVLVVRQSERQELEKILMNGTISTSTELLAAVTKQAKITIGGVAIEFTNAQLREIERRARKNRRPPEEELRACAKEMSKLMLDEA